MDQDNHLTVILGVFTGGTYPKECISYDFMELKPLTAYGINKGDISSQPIAIFEQYHLLYQPKFN